MIAVRGYNSAIVQALRVLAYDRFLAVGRDQDMPLDAKRYLFCAGVIRPKRAAFQTKEEAEESFRVNLWSVTDQCERILSANPVARICVVGSESGFTGSFDDNYAAAKRELHRYVETKKIGPDQQLVCVAPSVISDCGMTTRRADVDRLEDRRSKHPKRRFLEAKEVAALIHHLLYVDRGYLTGVTIRMNGGEHAW